MSRDLQELLRSTADAPTRPLDAAEVVGKARRQSRLLRVSAGVGAIVAVLAVVAGVTLPGDVVPTVAEQPGQEANAEELLNRTFGSVEVTADGQPRELVADTALRITFDPPSSLRVTDPETGEPTPVEADTVATWSGGCNSVTSPMDVTHGRLEPVLGRPTPPDGLETGEMHTLIACGTEHSEQDNWFTEVVRAEPRWNLESDRLTLETETVTIVLEERPPEFWLRSEP